MKLTDKQSVIIGYIVRAVLVIGASILIAVLLNSCYTQKKAEKQVDKALDEFPSVAANAIRKEFPCIVDADTVITYSIDTTGYEVYKYIAKLSRDSIQKLIDKIKADSSIERSYCKDYEVIIDTLYAENTQLALRLDNIKPVIKTVTKTNTVKDDAELFSLRDSLLKVNQKLDIANSHLTKYENKEKGKFAFYIPKWVIILIAILSLLIIILTIKKKLKL